MATAATTDQALAPEPAAGMDRDVRRAIALMRRIARNPYVPVRPTRHQVAYLLAEEREALFTGAGGNGKSTALMLAALLDVDRPGYRALVVQRLDHDRWDAAVERENAGAARLEAVSKRWPEIEGLVG